MEETINLITVKEPDYETAYYILMEYWDSLPEERKEEIDKELKECGL